ncbi:MAG: nitroreductase family protein [Planctomycetia bacterium]|nr:nitroreductase family protein [Planctomycetia bacterium]NCG13483.1 nitroreductase family protein [Planctomycetia bacterium]NCG56915.1 nitroreductase family protein [Pseudomonadota bacterium]
MSREYSPTPFSFERKTEEEMDQISLRLESDFSGRRSVRHFSSDSFPREWVDRAIAAASTAPSGAHRQPWHFVIVDEPDLKRQIRAAAEQEEQVSYGGRMPQEWLDALQPIGTDASKPFLEEAPFLVVLFAETHGVNDQGSKQKNYYVSESVGIAAGMFISAIHKLGLATLTHTPSPMKFLRDLLGRPSREKPFLLFPIGYPALECQVPDLKRKSLEEVRSYNRDGRNHEKDPANGE